MRVRNARRALVLTTSGLVLLGGSLYMGSVATGQGSLNGRGVFGPLPAGGGQVAPHGLAHEKLPYLEGAPPFGDPQGKRLLPRNPVEHRTMTLTVRDTKTGAYTEYIIPYDAEIQMEEEPDGSIIGRTVIPDLTEAVDRVVPREARGMHPK